MRSTSVPYWRPPGSVLIRGAEDLHRIELPPAVDGRCKTGTITGGGVMAP